MLIVGLDHLREPVPSGNIDFAFLPKALLKKCKLFIIRYHELNGFSSLPDILSHPQTSTIFDNADLEPFCNKAQDRFARDTVLEETDDP
jgi:hypothetical protein